MNTAGVLVATLAIASPALAQNATQRGIWAADLNRSVAPCDDFYEFANGAWRAANPIPAVDAALEPSLGGWRVDEGPAQEILDASREGRKSAEGQRDQLIGDFYGACMDEAEAQSAGCRSHLNRSSHRSAR